MSLTVRRVVTGHNADGKARVIIDEIAKNVVSGWPGANASVIWTDQGFPVKNDANADTSGRQVGTTLDNGIVFRVVGFGPASRRATTAPTRSTTRACFRARSTWSSTARPCT